MGLYTGVTGYIKNDEDTIAHIASWDVEISKDIIEVVSFGNDYKEKVPSIKDWSASADGQVDFASTSGQEDLITAFEAGTLLTMGFGLTDEIYFTGTGYIESVDISNSADGSAEISISIAGSDGILLTNPTS